MDAASLTVEGLPSGSRAWRGAVAQAAGTLAVGDGLALRFTLPARRWVDLDTLVEATVAGLRDAGAVAPRLAGLDAVVATKRPGTAPGAALAARRAATLAGRRAPGRVALTVATDDVPRPGGRERKRAWRARIAAAWGANAPLDGAVWADVALRSAGALLAPVEVVLDALEPVLGRDPRGRDWQEFFPNDHVVTWLRIRRVAQGPALTLRLGPVPVPTARDAGPAF